MADRRKASRQSYSSCINFSKAFYSSFNLFWMVHFSRALLIPQSILVPLEAIWLVGLFWFCPSTWIAS